MNEEQPSATTCTICGHTYGENDRPAFNAHIRAHLKDKLNSRREQRLQQKADEKERTTSTTTTTTTTTTNITKLLPLSPLPIIEPSPPKTIKIVPSAVQTKRTLVPAKPDLESLLNTFRAPALSSSVMAELAACKPIPPAQQTQQLQRPQQTTTKPTPVSPASPALGWSEAISADALLTPEISDMEEDLMSYEMEMNRIDFHNDLASILDQIEKDFESPCLQPDIRLDTPPDSDSENSDYITRLLESSTPHPRDSHNKPVSLEPDLLGFDRFTQRICLPNNDPQPLNQQQHHQQQQQQQQQQIGLDQIDRDDTSSLRLVQSPESVAKVGKLPAKALAVLSKLPSRLFVGGAGYVDVVKVEQRSVGDAKNTQEVLDTPNQVGAQCIINIECRQAGGDKILHTYRAIDTGSEIKLLPVLEAATPAVPPPPAQMAVVSQQQQQQHQLPKAKANSVCAVCGKCITTKNMARHMEKHVGKKKFECDVCHASFYQKTHLKHHVMQHEDCLATGEMHRCSDCGRVFSQRRQLVRHSKAGRCPASSATPSSSHLTCRVCGKVCKNRVSLVRHRAKHLACVHCSALFDNKVALHDHLLKAHPDRAIVSIVENSMDEPVLGPLPDDGDMSPDALGESLVDIADANYFDCNGVEISDEFYTPDLF